MIMKRIFLYLVPLLLLACDKVNKLSDEASIEQFNITALQPADARVEKPVIEPGKIRVGIFPRENLFPVTFQATIKTSATTVDVLDFPGTFRFETGNVTWKFFLIAASGVSHAQEVSIEPLDTGADILALHLPPGENASVTVDSWNATVEIAKDHVLLPYTIPLPLALSPGASTRDTIITFEEVGVEKTITVTGAGGTVTRDWKFSLAGPVQLPNADFEQWHGSGTSVNVGPSANEGAWGTANNTIIQGTLPVDNGSGLAAEMTTRIQTVPLLGHQLIAAGTLYTGHFSLSFNFEDPRSMTFFGTPYKHRVTAVTLDARYIPGPQLQQAVKNNSGKYVVQDIDGVDQGEAWVELVHWSGSTPLVYHGTPVTGLTVLGRGSFIFDGADASLQEWKNITLPVIYTNTGIPPTHVVIVFTSSREGDLFKGASGSKLTVDNVVLL